MSEKVKAFLVLASASVGAYIVFSFLGDVALYLLLVLIVVIISVENVRAHRKISELRDKLNIPTKMQ